YSKKLKETSKSGSGAPKLKKYHLYNQLLFLRKVEQNATESSLDSPREINNESTSTNDDITTDNTPRYVPVARKRAMQMDEFEREGLKLLKEPENRHMSFFRAILPSIQEFSDRETLRFQSKVIQIIDEMRYGQTSSYVSGPSTSHQPPYGYQTANFQNWRIFFKILAATVRRRCADGTDCVIVTLQRPCGRLCVKIFALRRRNATQRAVWTGSNYALQGRPNDREWKNMPFCCTKQLGERGTLSWPPRSEASSILDENSVPGKNWSTFPCIVKRICNTYKAAGLAADRISLTDVNASFLLKNDNEEVIKNQAKIMEILQDVQNTQKRILQQLARHEVQFIELLNKMADCSVTTMTRTNCESSVEERFPPIKTVEELFQLEDNLKDPEFRSKYYKIRSLGAKGTNICYKATLKPVSVSTPTNRKKRTTNTKSLSDAAESNIECAADVEVEQHSVNVDEQLFVTQWLPIAIADGRQPVRVLKWFSLVRWAKKDGKPYNVIEMKHGDFYNYKDLLAGRNWSKNISGDVVKWNKVKEVRLICLQPTFAFCISLKTVNDENANPENTRFVPPSIENQLKPTEVLSNSGILNENQSYQSGLVVENPPDKPQELASPKVSSRATVYDNPVPSTSSHVSPFALNPVARRTKNYFSSKKTGAASIITASPYQNSLIESLNKKKEKENKKGQKKRSEDDMSELADCSGDEYDAECPYCSGSFSQDTRGEKWAKCQALVDFFILHWTSEEMIPFIGNNQVFINFRQCHSFTVSNNKVMSEINEDLSCPQHEEADTKIVYHVCNTDARDNFFRRANYIASVWNNASAKMINILNPENYGWTLEDDKYHFHWFDGDQLPDFVSQSLEEELAKKPEENTDEQDDDLNIQYQDRIDDELPDFNDDDNED
ncbi:hypothetical protein HW555_012938, partial [Spodoptera exigua]